MCVLFLLLIFVVDLASASSPDLCWRPFMGIVPLDAIVAASNNGVNTYIGKVYLPREDVILTGELFEGQDYMTIASPADGSLLAANSNIEILCSTFPEYFHWIVPPKFNIFFASNYYRVEGGRAADDTIRYIGRGVFKNVWRVGIVNLNRLYFINFEDECEDNLRNYEVLVYSNTTIGQSCL